MTKQELISFTNERFYTEADFDGFNAAPLLLVGSESRVEVIARQDKLAENFARAIREELSPIVKPKVVDYITHSVLTRMQQREALNGVSYNRRLFTGKPGFHMVPVESPAFIKQAINRAKNGGSTVYENHVARRALGMGTIELANHTTFGELRKDEEIPMWEAISETVGHDASPHYKDMYRLRILGFSAQQDNPQNIGAMRIGMKRLIGESHDEALVKARTTAIINTSPSSGFDQSIVKEFLDIGLSSKNWEMMAELPSFQKAVRWLIESEVPPGIVLAKNETIYELHPPTQAEIERRLGYDFNPRFSDTGPLEVRGENAAHEPRLRG